MNKSLAINQIVYQSQNDIDIAIDKVNAEMEDQHCGNCEHRGHCLKQAIIIRQTQITVWENIVRMN